MSVEFLLLLEWFKFTPNCTWPVQRSSKQQWRPDNRQAWPICRWRAQLWGWSGGCCHQHQFQHGFQTWSAGNWLLKLTKYKTLNPRLQPRDRVPRHLMNTLATLLLTGGHPVVLWVDSCLFSFARQLVGWSSCTSCWQLHSHGDIIAVKQFPWIGERTQVPLLINTGNI